MTFSSRVHADVREHYPWLKLLFVPAACTDLVQPADRGMISWLKANMRATFTDTISADVLRQLQAGTNPVDVTLDVSAPHLKHMLAIALAKALSELPKETVLHCWAPLQAAFDDMTALHAKASEQLDRLFPNKATHVPDAVEEEPMSDADDDYEEPAPKEKRGQRKCADAESAEHDRAADVAVANSVPARRPFRAAAAAANAAMDVLDERGELE
jgi:hypothetical protein